MDKKIFAAIDIGSNSARLLIKSFDESSSAETVLNPYKVFFIRIPLRLGIDVFSKGKLSEGKREMTMHMMKAFKQILKVFNVDDYRICATSAMREAKNAKDFVKEVKKETGMNIEIISGDEEADIVYNKHIQGLEDRMKNYAYVDVGGGSTEIIVVKDRRIVLEKSFRVGTMRMLNIDNMDANETVLTDIRKSLKELVKDDESIEIIGSGGNINKLYKLSSAKDKENISFPVSNLQDMHDAMAPLSIDQRMQKYSLKRERADVIVPACEIFLTIAKCLNTKSIYVPMVGLADRIIDQLYEKSLK
jgi:exopolyphosphatase/guanosine-5'-triphosphate,3'-diphosphate pyrophosphatase